jgi:membrane fusion protein (multidrug efflux system)
VFRKHFFLVVALVVIGTMIVAGGARLLFTGKGQQAQQAQGGGGGGGRGGQPVAVVPATVTPRLFANDIEVLGAAKARQSVTLTAAATQLVTKINFQSGQYVRQGQVLAELNAREQDANIIQAQAALEFAEKTRDRWQALADRGVAPKATAEQYQSAYEQAKANLAANQARAGDRTIRAPFSGVVGLSDAAPGMLINPGATIATLDDVSVIRVDFPVAERFLGLLKEGLPITATTDAYPDRVFTGNVAKLDTRLDPSSRSLIARAEFSNADGRLRPGMLMHVAIKQDQRTSPSVLESAVAFEGQAVYVLAIEPGPKGLTAIRRDVKIGVRQAGYIEILSGLEVGDQVMAEGLNRVQSGARVVISGPGGANGKPGGAGRRKPAA